MPVEMIEFLESIGQKSHRSNGLKVAKTEVVRATISAFKKIGIDVTGLQNAKDLEKRAILAAKSYS